MSHGDATDRHRRAEVALGRAFPARVARAVTDLVRRLAAGVLVLDGGLATTLEAAGHELSGRLWSARLLHEAPVAVLAAHREFVAAGADVVSTATYQASVDGLIKAGARPSQAWRVIAGSVALVRGAAEQAGRDDVLVAGSCGPYAATFADGSEYRGYGSEMTVARLRDFHRERARILVDGGADILAFETLPSAREAQAVAEVLAELDDVPAWVSFTTPDGHATAEGQPLAEAAGALADGPVAVGVNCCTPDTVAPALTQLAAALPGTPLVAYPNAGDRWDPSTRRWVAPAGRAAATEVPSWLRAGARVVGGCCGTSPEDVRRIAHRVQRHSEAR